MRCGATPCDAVSTVRNDRGSRGRGFESRQPDHETAGQTDNRILSSTVVCERGDGFAEARAARACGGELRGLVASGPVEPRERAPAQETVTPRQRGDAPGGA